MATRSGLQQVGATLLEQILNARQMAGQPSEVECGCGERAGLVGYRSKQLWTVLGRVNLRRAYYWCRQCGTGQAPGDRHLDIRHSRFSPGVRRIASQLGSQLPFREAAEDLEMAAGLALGAKAVERISKQVGGELELSRAREEEAVWRAGYQVSVAPIERLYVEIDGTGIPVVRQETAGRKGRQADGSAKTREVKMGCIFTQTLSADREKIRRDEDSTSYVAAIETAHTFGRRLYAEAVKRGVEQAREVVVVADGAAWIWNLVEEHFPEALQIVDLYHAREHLYELKGMLSAQLLQEFLHRLDRGRIDQLVQGFRGLPARQDDQVEMIRRQINYFETHAHRMPYADFRKRRLFIGSGVVEAACKTIIGARLKQSGMFWSVRGANQILSLRSTLKSGYWDDYWENRPLN